MFRNYIITAFRTLKKNKAYAFINIIGLALGLGCALVIFKVVRYELSFDKHHENYENIYRVISESIYPDRVDQGMGNPHPLGIAVREDFTNVLKVTRTHAGGGDQLDVTNEQGELDKFLIDDGIAFVENEFFQIFTTKWIAGDMSKALVEPSTVVLSETGARTLFKLKEGEEHLAMGRIIHYKNDFKVIGIIHDIPKTSNFTFDYIFDYKSLTHVDPYYREGKQWNSTSSNTNTYVLLNPGQSASSVDEQFPTMIEKYINKEENERRRYKLQTLSNIHFNTKVGAYSETVSFEFLYAIGIIGLFLILTASINFINLATAQAANRAKEIGIRKSIGSRSEQLIAQFMSEVSMITFIGLIVSLAFAEIMFILLEKVIGYRLYLDLFHDPVSLVFILVLFLVVSFISGFYPSFLLARMNTIQALKSKMSNTKTSGFSLRKGLVVLQFSISQFLIIGTLVVTAQMNFFSNAGLGFEKEAIINSYLPVQDKVKMERFKETLIASPAIKSLSFMLSQPTGNNNSSSNFDYAPLNSEISYHANFKCVDEDYFDLFGLKLLAGRQLRKGDSSNVIIVNRKIAELMGFEDNYEAAIGENLNTGWGGDKKIVGIMENFLSKSLQEPIDFVLLIHEPQVFYSMSFKLASSASIDAGLDHFRKTWENVYPEYVLDYDFFDEALASYYEKEKRISSLMRIFSMISIIIGCLGLYGLISFIAINRTKEIGVRKVLGASVFNILGLFSREIVMLTGIAFLIAAPLAYYLTGQWLETYAHSIDLGMGYFLLAFGITISIALLTIAHRSISTAMINPATTLKDE
ncbi:MAG: FtsX-like permease family protein [Cyclobacteriaceae bacterium]